ncbi:hypothetical protein TEA_012006 [Camellia sinensis var. sinensis]|uniref:Exocyst subunit Exo70 family protein n=1 Tax=Camellia sinensis var. sinensis TaxID=542762 RepID=A0A4S4DV68_CAMSN|nr:hypothetical protein TEA_012006 [Camellia sinensis var. sinensis]
MGSNSHPNFRIAAAADEELVDTMNWEIRAAILEQSLRKLGVEKLTKDDVQRMQWEVKLLFAGERKVCDQIFEGVDSLREQCFADVTESCVAVLLSFGEAIAKSKRSPEKLFVLLDMYEIMRELQPEDHLVQLIDLSAGLVSGPDAPFNPL